MTNHQIRVARYLVSRGVEIKKVAERFGVRESTVEAKLYPSAHPMGFTGVLTRAEVEAYAEQFDAIAAG